MDFDIFRFYTNINNHSSIVIIIIVSSKNWNLKMSDHMKSKLEMLLHLTFLKILSHLKLDTYHMDFKRLLFYRFIIMLMQVFIMGVCVYYFENRTHYYIIMNHIIIVMNCILANCGNDVSCNCHQIV